jgi:hypothetical protein
LGKEKEPEKSKEKQDPIKLNVSQLQLRKCCTKYEYLSSDSAGCERI